MRHDGPSKLSSYGGCDKKHTLSGCGCTTYHHCSCIHQANRDYYAYIIDRL